MLSKESAYTKISQLVTRFSEQIGSYKNSDYNETLTRRDFIDPFFKALGWDMDNEEGSAEAYREVIHEDKIKVGSATKAPDYSFRLAGGKRLFFVEAKKPSVFVKEEIPPAYQIRRYGWSAKLPVSIVTDFEEFAIYDCTKKPKATDKASTARIKYLTYKEYLTEFDFLWDTFSKERVLKGSFDKFVLSDTGKKGTATVDKEFLESLNQWRKLLAESISINNIKLNEDELNFAVQQTLDRIIFLRICEDRGVEPYKKLKYCLNPPLKDEGVYKNLFVYFEEADKKYNSGLFDFKKDDVSYKLNIDNKVLKKIIEELYYPDSPYEFSVLSVEILGSAYEQFLGKVIRLTPSHRAKIEEKPEVRKAGGVYYTPQYIVEYIVKNTVGKLLEGKTPKEIEKIKIVDPACGSGSFLIGAYQYLLDWHLSYYMQDPLVRQSRPLPLGKGETLSGQKDNIEKVPSLPRRGFRGGLNNTLTPDGRLTTAEKKRILINNIYGVDIDTQATEVTKLSLLLKCMEGETLASVQQTMSFVQERILPTLENNIKSGNSLIDMDFYDGELEFKDHPAPAKAGSPLLNKEGSLEKKIKPFNWQAAFPEVFKQGGFDCVIGNPPYVSTKVIHKTEKIYFLKNYETALGQFDLYGLFLERGYQILKNEGKLGFITSSTYLSNKDFIKLRELLLYKTSINTIINFGETVFVDANLDVSIIIFSKSLIENNKIKIYRNSKNFFEHTSNTFKQEYFKNEKNNFEFHLNIENEDYNVINKIFTNKIELSLILDLPRGIELGSNSDKIIEKVKNGYSKLLVGKNIKKYSILFDNMFIKFEDNKSVFKEKSIYNNEKILIQRIRNLSLATRIVATLDTESYLCTNTLRIGLLKNKTFNIKYILGVLNSKLVNYIFLKLFLNKDIYAYQLERIPIKQIDFTNPAEKKKHDEIVKLVETMLELNKELQKAKLATGQEQIKQRITYTDKKIDALVYELYGLTEEEIKVVEGE